jgi:hypothetical protein
LLFLRQLHKRVVAISRWYCPSHEISELEAGETCPGRGGPLAWNNNPARGSTNRGGAAHDPEPKENYHAPKHWHTANETHTVVSGTFIMKDEGGKVEVLGPGSFNYMPAKMEGPNKKLSPPN